MIGRTLETRSRSSLGSKLKSSRFPRHVRSLCSPSNEQLLAGVQPAHRAEVRLAGANRHRRQLVRLRDRRDPMAGSRMDDPEGFPGRDRDRSPRTRGTPSMGELPLLLGEPSPASQRGHRHLPSDEEGGDCPARVSRCSQTATGVARSAGRATRRSKTEPGDVSRSKRTVGQALNPQVAYQEESQAMTRKSLPSKLSLLSGSCLKLCSL